MDEGQDLRRLYQSIKTIAVVGLSDNEARPSFEVASYLKNQGYKIIPVNPMIESWMGEKSYSSLEDIAERVDVVDIFRKPEFVGEIMDQAIKIDAKVVWMQEGIVNEKAAQKGRDAGLTVVMDRCLMKEHKKL
ncbi:TPA: CoA-binding protein [Candidatus Beckwithbacteria bacterium]|nr:CoA-binding protein [Candidatus Beckwithbacteria bacterium]